MNLARLALAWTFVLIVSSETSAATLEVSLDLSTPVDPWTTVVDEVVLEVPDAPITSIAVRLTGTWVDQSYWCFFPYVNESAPARLEIGLADDVSAEPRLSALYSFPESEEPQSFDVEIVLFEGGTAPLNFLDDGIFEAGLTIRAIQGIYSGSWPCSELNVPVQVDEAILRIGYDGGVPTTTRSWGALKRSWD